MSLSIAALTPTHLVAAASTVCPYGDSSCSTGLTTTGASAGNLQSLAQAIFAAFGVIAVLMVVIGGMQLILAQGDPQAAAHARKTIIYAVAGLAIAISAELIVSFVLNRL
jgi:hypothetical protein